jgi:hypothetical protein
MKTALSELPRTLDETYSRILANIPVDYTREAEVIFQLLSVSYGPMNLETLAEAVVIDTQRNEFHVEARLWNNKDILEICGGLVILITHWQGDWILPPTKYLP